MQRGCHFFHWAQVFPALAVGRTAFCCTLGRRGSLAKADSQQAMVVDLSWEPLRISPPCRVALDLVTLAEVLDLHLVFLPDQGPSCQQDLSTVAMYHLKLSDCSALVYLGLQTPFFLV